MSQTAAFEALDVTLKDVRYNNNTMGGITMVLVADFRNIPRIGNILSDFPFQFKHLQIPVRLSFVISINKAQGQSLKVVGLYLLKPCFSYGQLYVCCSTVGKADNLYILAINGRTANIVYPEDL
ncbi:hypothetical protein AVEN_157552-1 [Araneus ventricosus]|uniref:ATP-dependent DNA helicase n=1 Tax=Araneus ventricosus TaxID=182803 RepID=A0A4Y2KG07_ARAVE|nr:hypothetical protein AVEN_157552-1 [Araneus ventricosus]